MSVKLSEQTKRQIDPKIADLKDGQIAVIMTGEYKGEIVQRYYKDLICVGKSGENGWSGRFKSSGGMMEQNIHILKNGETLIIEGNK